MKNTLCCRGRGNNSIIHLKKHNQQIAMKQEIKKRRLMTSLFLPI